MTNFNGSEYFYNLSCLSYSQHYVFFANHVAQVAYLPWVNAVFFRLANELDKHLSLSLCCKFMATAVKESIGSTYSTLFFFVHWKNSDTNNVIELERFLVHSLVFPS